MIQANGSIYQNRRQFNKSKLRWVRFDRTHLINASYGKLKMLKLLEILFDAQKPSYFISEVFFGCNIIFFPTSGNHFRRKSILTFKWKFFLEKLFLEHFVRSRWFPMVFGKWTSIKFQFVIYNFQWHQKKWLALQWNCHMELQLNFLCGENTLKFDIFSNHFVAFSKINDTKATDLTVCGSH